MPNIAPSENYLCVEKPKFYVSMDSSSIKYPPLVDIEKCLKSFHAEYDTGHESEYIVRYFELLHEYANMDIADLYCDKNVKSEIKTTISLEIVGVLLHWYFVKFKLFSRVEKQDVRKMLWHIYQNFLLIIDCVLRRLPSNANANHNERWIKSLTN